MPQWALPPGSEEVLSWLDKYFPAYGQVARHHAPAIDNETVISGGAELVEINGTAVFVPSGDA
ncbi:hypothetical protein H2203_005346 [Taxawa tesnikishii (nom. ined.)]|nr:hypothetical protein H2203_005346 [Dothideales sp. JES 119]